MHRNMIIATAVVAVLLFIAFAIIPGCRTNGSSDMKLESGSDPFLAAFQAAKYEEALGIVEEALRKNPDDGIQIHYRGACFTMLERYEDAVESFMLGELNSPEGFSDRTILYLRALSLFNIKTFRRAQQVLDTLAQSYPHSRLSKRGQELALKIEKRLAEGLKEGTLNWYLNEGLEAYDAARPALAAEYLGEYFLLAARMEDSRHVDDARANFSLGGAYIELGEDKKAVQYLERVPVSYEGYSGGLMLAMALYASGEKERSAKLLGEIAQKAEGESIREQAQRLLEAWTSE
jgi:tetratricopeptide (TPR) repeat protein